MRYIPSRFAAWKRYANEMRRKQTEEDLSETRPQVLQPAAKRKRADQMSKTGESSNKVRAPRVTRSMSRDLDDNDDAEEVVYAVKVRVVRGHDLDYN